MSAVSSTSVPRDPLQISATSVRLEGTTGCGELGLHVYRQIAAWVVHMPLFPNLVKLELTGVPLLCLALLCSRCR